MRQLHYQVYHTLPPTNKYLTDNVEIPLNRIKGGGEFPENLCMVAVCGVGRCWTRQWTTEVRALCVSACAHVDKANGSLTRV